MSMQKIIEDYRCSFGPGRQNTALAYCADVRQLGVYLERTIKEGINDWASVTSEQVLGYVRDLSDGGLCRPSTAARKCSAIKSFCRYLFSRGMVTQDLLDLVTSFSVSTPEQKAPQIVSQEQIEQFFASVNEKTPGGLRDLALMQLCTDGLRTSEILALDLTDIDREGKSLSCPSRGELRRILPLSASTGEIIQRYLEQGRPQLVRNTDEPALFVNHQGKRLSRQGIWLILKEYAKRVGTPITPRILRHTSVVAMLKSGMEMSQVQEALGFMRSTSLQVYTQLVNCEEGIRV
jgi:integrase/recombinase XerD